MTPEEQKSYPPIFPGDKNLRPKFSLLSITSINYKSSISRPVVLFNRNSGIVPLPERDPLAVNDAKVTFPEGASRADLDGPFETE
jgi:hypothetical protein